MASFNDDCRWQTATWSIHVISAMLSLITFFNISNGANQVAVSWENTCVLSGTNVSCWGSGSWGILGTGNQSNLYVPPTSPIDLGDDFMTAAIDCGWFHCCGVSTNKRLKCWGGNLNGQLGQGDINSRGNQPGEMGNNLSVIDLGSDFDVDHVSCGVDHTCVLSTNQSIKCFGYGLGYGNTNNIGDDENEMGDDLSVISLGTDFIPIQVVCGGWHSCALSVDYQIKCWGDNGYGELGQGDTTNRGYDINQMGDNLTSIDLGTGFNASSIHCGDSFVCALSTDHDTKCWGWNEDGQLGLGDTNDRGDSSGEMGNNLSVLNLGTDFVPQRVGGGMMHNLILSVDGTIKGWGYNSDGQLGYGDTNNRGDEGNEMGDNLPLIDVGDGFIVIDISSGCWVDHSCALLENGTGFLGLKCWGLNDEGQLGLGDTLNRGAQANEMGDELQFVSVIFPALLTPLPTTEPTAETTVPTTNPTDEPTETPTHTPSTSTSGLLSLLGEASGNTAIIGVIVVVISCFSILSCVVMWSQYKNKKSKNESGTELQTLQIGTDKKQTVMSNGLIVNIPIGTYDDNTAVPNDNLKSWQVPVRGVVDDMRQFAVDFGYKYLPLDDRTYWTEQQILSFLRDDVGNEFFEGNGSPKYDGLILCITSRGDERHVLSSDHQIMEKTAIHRIISNKYSAIRDFPRIFIFDACNVASDLMVSLLKSSVSRQTDETIMSNLESNGAIVQHVMAATNDDLGHLAEVIVETQPDDLEMENGNDVTKNTTLDDVREINEWTHSTKNPDFNLVIVDSVGDTSISNVTHFFTERVRQNTENHEGLGLSDVMENIRTDLRNTGVVSFVSILNNETPKMLILKKCEK